MKSLHGRSVYPNGATTFLSSQLSRCDDIRVVAFSDSGNAVVPIWCDDIRVVAFSDGGKAVAPSIDGRNAVVPGRFFRVWKVY